MALALSDKGVLVADPEIELIGIPEPTPAAGRWRTSPATRSRRRLKRCPSRDAAIPNEVAEAVRRAVRWAIAERWNKKPICHVHVLSV